MLNGKFALAVSSASFRAFRKPCQKLLPFPDDDVSAEFSRPEAVGDGPGLFAEMQDVMTDDVWEAPRTIVVGTLVWKECCVEVLTSLADCA